MDIRQIPLDELVLDATLNLRDRLDQETVERYVEVWERMPPVTVYEVDSRWLLADGFHRHAAGVTANKKSIRAEVRVGTFSEALDFVAGANLFHGLPLTRGERRRAVELKLRLHHDRSDRLLSEELSVGRDLIARIRRQLVEAGQIPDGATRLGADGKVYPAGLPRDPNEHVPRGKARSSPDDPRDRGLHESDAAPWDDTVDPLPVQGPTTAVAPWEATADAKAIAKSPPVPVAAPSIEEMLALMTRQIMEVVGWTQAEGFADAYKNASGNARGLFHTAAIKIAARAEQLRKV
jgi:hypothetical protein